MSPSARRKGDGDVPFRILSTATLRSRVEHAFHIIKDRFHHRKRRYQGLKKNAAQHEGLCALANLIIAKPALLAA